MSWITNWLKGSKVLHAKEHAAMRMPRPFPRGRFNVAIIGHSFLANYSTAVFCTAAGVTNNGDGTATATLNTSSHGLLPGDYIKASATGSTATNVMRGRVTAAPVSSALVTYRLGGITDQRGAGAGGTSAFLSRVDYVSLRNEGYLTWLNARLGGRMRIVADASVGGAAANELILMAPLVLDACTAPIDFVIVQPFFNDVYGGAATISSLKSWADSIYDILDARGLGDRVLWLGELPSRSGYASWSLAKTKVMLSLNTWLAQWVPYRGGIFVPTWQATTGSVAYVTPGDANTNLEPDSTMVQSDLVHPSGRGAWAIGANVLAPILSNFVAGGGGPVNHSLDEYASNAYNLIDNPDFSGTGGTHSGTATIGSGSVPTGWTLTTTGTGTIAISTVSRTLAADGDAAGTYLRLTVTGANNLNMRLGPTSAITSRISSGDKCRMNVKTRFTSGASPGTGAPVQLDYVRVIFLTTHTNFQNAIASFGTNATGMLFSEATPWLDFTSNDVTIPEAPTGALWYFYVQFTNSAGGEATIDIYLPSLQKIQSDVGL